MPGGGIRSTSFKPGVRQPRRSAERAKAMEAERITRRRQGTSEAFVSARLSSAKRHERRFPPLRVTSAARSTGRFEGASPFGSVASISS